MFPQLRLRAVFKTRVNVLSDRPSTYTYGSNGILMKFDFSKDKSRFLQSKGSHAAILHVWQTWATPEVSSNMSRFWKILTMISISISSHLRIEEYISSITHFSEIPQMCLITLQTPRKKQETHEHDRLWELATTSISHPSNILFQQELKKFFLVPNPKRES